ncbi:hypothetical protein ALC53_05534 [Atta colombica]|uniref:Uncharacterized protein n=1 Tax=Atta colombica TaxID=520822 RepID=A0A195BIG2_9HYME|nr:hypothetical protein ALC53_05534 [Atta colombica]
MSQSYLAICTVHYGYRCKPFVFANRSDCSTIIFGGSVEHLDRKRGLSRMDQCDEKNKSGSRTELNEGSE